MKKFLAIALILCLLCGMSALAENQTISGTSGSKTASTTLKTTISEGYTIEIPATVEIPFNQVSTELSVKVSALHLNKSGENTTRKLQVRLWDTGALTNGSGGKLGNAIEGSDLVDNWYLYFTELGTKSVTIKIPSSVWNKAPAGEYTSNLKFYISIGDF